MLLPQIIRRVDIRNFDNSFAMGATLQKLRGCYRLSRCKRCARTLYFFN
jgi:hypothetical protein